MCFEERVAWIINLIKKREGLNNVQLGEKLGVNKNTVQAYSKGTGDLKGIALAGIVKHFGIDGQWLIAGHGEPFPGARDKYPDVCGPEEYAEKQQKVSLVNDGTADYDNVRQFKISEDLTLATRVLESNTPYATALHLNIRSFARAVDADNRIAQVESEIDNLKKSVNDLVEENRLLNERLNKVGATAGTGQLGGTGEPKNSVSGV